MKPWIGVDLDGTLAVYDGFKGPGIIGDPIPLMVERVKEWLDRGKDVRIFTARVYGLQNTYNTARRREAEIACNAIDTFCLENFGRILPVTCTKDYGMVELWDDRAVQVVPNTGSRADEVAHVSGQVRMRDRCMSIDDGYFERIQALPLEKLQCQ